MEKKYNNLEKKFKRALRELPEEAKTKINRSGLDRGGGGIYTKRRKRNDVALVLYESFKINYNSLTERLDEIYRHGWRIVCTPKEYFQEVIHITSKVVVEFEKNSELTQFPIDWSNVKLNRKDYKSDEPMFVQNIKNLNKHSKSEKTRFFGPSSIGQQEMDYATEDEILYVKMSLLYQMIKMVDFWQFFPEKKYSFFEEFKNEFEKTELYTQNPNLKFYCDEYGYTVCPELIKVPKRELAILKFSDIIDGSIKGDIGRNDFNRTTTKINIHHTKKLIAGKLNHNHKNVFLGSATGNSIDAALQMIGKSLVDLF
jgi:hypothetical protein